MSTGSFIVFEGIDGSGKSTQARRLAEALGERGYEVVLTREPTDRTAAGRRLREIARQGREGLPLEEETRLFMEDRAEHCRDLIAPALEAGKTVVTDRFWYSTAAYQGALGADTEAIAEESRRRFPTPDLVFYLEIDPENALERIRAGRPEGLAPAYEKLELLREVSRRYRRLCADHCVRIEATLPENEIAARVLEAALPAIERSGLK